MRSTMLDDVKIGETLNPITLELIRGSILSVRGEMESLIERTAMSPIIREKKDYFAGVYDVEGKLVFGTYLPLFGNIVDAILEQYPPETMAPGDVYWYNDPYASRGGVSHSPDQVYVAPVFHDGALVAFSQCFGHFWDIGGARPGSLSPANTEIFHEGILVPPVRLYRQGVLNEEAYRIFLRNSRFPEIVRGDVNTLIAAARLGESRIQALFDRFGHATMLAAFRAFIDQAKTALEAAITDRLADGEFSFRDWIDTDGQTGQAFSVKLHLSKHGHATRLDLTESDDQAPGTINFLMHESVPKLVYGLYLTSDDPTVLMNDGFVRAMGEVRIREGSILQPRFPAPLGSRSHTLFRVQQAVFATIALATGGDAPAATPVYNLNILRSLDRATGQFTLVIDGVAVGYGARPKGDGIDAVYYVAQKNFPAEFMEAQFPVRLERYAIHIDSGGPGKHRGGCGVVRDLRLLADEAVLATRMDNCTFPCWGVNGGQAGRPGRVLLNPGAPDEREIDPMSEGTPVRRGDVVRLMTPGGGGWGDPFERDPERVRRDVLGGFVSRESAERDYGVVLSGDRLAVDVERTARLRAATRPTRKMFHRFGYFDHEDEPGAGGPAASRGRAPESRA